MSERNNAVPPPEGFGGMKPLGPFLDTYFPMPDGTPRSQRNQYDFARRYGIKVIRRGNTNYVDEELEAQRMRDSLHQAEAARVPRGPGRPRKIAG